MPDTSKLQATPLERAHRRAGARMIPFAGWSMPVQYSGVIDEHVAVRERAGLFDVSHMGELIVRGNDAEAFLQHVTCNDVSRLRPGRIHYSGLTTPEGGFVDDLLVYRRSEDYFLVVNAANTEKDLRWLRAHLEAFGSNEVEIRDESLRWALIAIQGPRALDILGPHADADLTRVKYYRFVETAVGGVDCLVSRTGYTGEDGFEIYAAAATAEGVWDRLLAAGEGAGLVPAGLGARDTLRLEAKMALYGMDIDETTTPFEADLGWIVKLAQGPFVGRDVLARQAEAGVERKLVGFEMQSRAIARHGYPALHEQREVGRVTSGSFAPFLKKNIGLVYMPTELAEPGVDFRVQIRGREEPARVVPTPFYQRPR